MFAVFVSTFLSLQSPAPLSFQGGEIRFRARFSAGGEWLEEFSARDAKGVFRPILISPNDASIRLVAPRRTSPALRVPGGNLFSAPPSLAFSKASSIPWVENGKTLGRIVSFFGDSDGVHFHKSLWLPQTGRLIRVEQTAVFPRNANPVHHFMSSYAFAPDLKPLSRGGKPDSTFSPGLRPRDDQVVGDHFFRAPVISAQRGALAALMMPDVEVLNENRPMPTILDLDAKNGVVDATLMSYGFVEHRLVGHVYFATDSSRLGRAPKELRLVYDLILNAQAEPFGAYREALPIQWAQYGKPMFEKVLPQAMPFAEYAEYCYPRVFEEAYGANKIGWFEVEIDGKKCGGISSGWGFREGWVSWQSWFNQLRSAWGLRWWGKKLGKADWVDKADKMLNLALAAPMDGGLCPTTYQSREKTWKGSLITPSPDCYYDLTNIAWKGIWLLRFLEFEDCPRREDIERQVSDMAMEMAKHQNEDGSFPSWLGKDHKPVPILDHSAQTALPAWFMAEILADYRDETSATFLYTKMTEGEGAKFKPGIYVRSRLGASLLKAADFLVKNVVDQQRWYDFETFFSCSPKRCLLANGKLDDLAMHDSHTLSPPQNTLSMQWAAEALMGTARLLDGPGPTLPPNGPRQSVASFILEAAQRTARVKPFRQAAMKSLDIMALYQNVSNLSYRKAAYIFGGFGVQNSDGEYLDARQAQFGCTLADFGALLNRQDYFERGVAATRAAMTLINHPLHAANGLYPNPNYPPGLQPENTGHGGTDQQNGRTGFDWGEGSGLASMAWLLHKYGSTYEGKGWRVLVDGGNEGQKNFPKPVPPLTDPVFDFSDWRMPGWTVEGNFAEVPTFSTRFDFGVPRDEGFIGTCEDGIGGYNDSYIGTITSPEFVITKTKLSLLVGGGSGPGVFVELIDPEGRALFTERGRNSERMHAVVWDISGHRGKKVRLRIVDRETGGWGHVNVGRVRVRE